MTQHGNQGDHVKNVATVYHQSPVDGGGIVERRRIFELVEARLHKRKLPGDVNDSTVAVKEFGIVARDGLGILMPRAVMVYLHAGGFLFGDLDSGDMNCRILAKRLGISVLNVEYHLAPEWKFPYGVEDALTE
ncbi:hypothetical protein DM02DRAFT_624119 [Periconia macrospinosa]|uniref:Alpha/beta hydrolase fold-3 domain-containing protein n=1 Tax=Periconia macrospinosa TaxID=97972 RepID=A0A2V1E5L0_9PLEO|nr:hypothetical protein DM02DRAFT_624119 [Periconia macrospinosa]